MSKSNIYAKVKLRKEDKIIDGSNTVPKQVIPKFAK